MDYKIMAIEVNEAKEKNIKTLDDFKRLNTGHIEEI
jgi:hypothetical protein